MLALEPHNNHVIASAARQSRTLQVNPVYFAIASYLNDGSLGHSFNYIR
jgi:hypothetical protein